MAIEIKGKDTSGRSLTLPTPALIAERSVVKSGSHLRRPNMHVTAMNAPMTAFNDASVFASFAQMGLPETKPVGPASEPRCPVSDYRRVPREGESGQRERHHDADQEAFDETDDESLQHGELLRR